MTDDPAIPQQGPMQAWVLGVEVPIEPVMFKAPLARILTKAREFDTAFDALERALREMNYALGKVNDWGEGTRVRAAIEQADAALALAEGVSS